MLQPRLFSFLLSTLLTLVTLFGATPIWAKQNTDKRIIVNETLKSVDQAITKVYVGADFSVPKYFKQKLIASNDLSLIEVDAVKNFISSDGKNKKIYLIRYTLGDERMSQVLADARANFSTTDLDIQLITDANPFAKVDFADAEKWTGDPLRFQVSTESEGGKFIHRLLESGLKWNEQIFSQPVYNTKVFDRVPIMHEKAMIMISDKGAKMLIGTANLARNPRYNRIFEVTDPIIIDQYVQHFENLKQAYKAGLETKKATATPWTKITYKDGTWLELAYTDGRFNPNERMMDLFKNTELSPKLKSILLSHFVLTHRGFMSDLESALRANPELKVNFVGDDRFASLDEWGLSPAFIGVNIYSPFNRNFVAFEKDLWPRVEGVIYQRPAIDPITGQVRIEKTEEGPPTARHLWHDKTSLFEFTDVAHVFTGSFNLSNNDANAEVQMQMQLPINSWLVTAIKYSVTQTIKKDKQFAIPLMIATLRNAIGLVFGLTDLEVPVKDIQKLYQYSIKGDRDNTFTILRNMAKINSQLSRSVSFAERIKRVNQFSSFLDWYLKNARQPQQTIADILPKLISMSILIGKPKIPAIKKADIVGSLLATSGQNTKWISTKIEEAFTILGLGRFNPYISAEVRFIDMDNKTESEIVEALARGSSTTKKHFLLTDKDPQVLIDELEILQSKALANYNKEIDLPEDGEVYPRTITDLGAMLLDLKSKGVTTIRISTKDKVLSKSISDLATAMSLTVRFDP
jgi:hypothetical protein